MGRTVVGFETGNKKESTCSVAFEKKSAAITQHSTALRHCLANKSDAGYFFWAAPTHRFPVTIRNKIPLSKRTEHVKKRVGPKVFFFWNGGGYETFIAIIDFLVLYGKRRVARLPFQNGVWLTLMCCLEKFFSNLPAISMIKKVGKRV